MSETETGDWCSQSEASRRLAEIDDHVSQQKLSRYLARYPEIPRREQGEGLPMLVDFEALRRHRAENVTVQEAKAVGGERDDDDAASLRLRERRAAAELRELDLAKAQGEVISRAAVHRAIAAAAVALQQAHQRTRFERAEALEATPDARAKVQKLAEQDSAVEAAFAQALSKLAGNGAGENEQEETGIEASVSAAPT